MHSIISPIFIFGDYNISSKSIILAKTKFPQYQYITLSFSDLTMDEIRSEVGTFDWGETEKVFIIKDILANKKARDFLIDICTSLPATSKIILWDSQNQIKASHSSSKIPKAWEDFISAFKEINGSQVVNNGGDYTDKDELDCISFIKRKFEKANIIIEEKEAVLLSKIVSRSKSMLDCEIDKLIITAPDHITSEFIIENAFPLTETAVLYKFANMIDTSSNSKILKAIEDFIDMGANPNVLAEIMMKKIRWQLVISYYFFKKMSWDDIEDKIMGMGKFPSALWHNDSIEFEQKKKLSESYSELDKMVEFMVRKQGIPSRCFKGDEKKSAETIPMNFMAAQAISFIRDNVVKKNSNQRNIKQYVLDRAKDAYLNAYEKLVDIRMENNKIQYLQEMALIISSP